MSFSVHEQQTKAKDDNMLKFLCSCGTNDDIRRHLRNSYKIEIVIFPYKDRDIKEYKYSINYGDHINLEEIDSNSSFDSYVKYELALYHAVKDVVEHVLGLSNLIK